jgi:tetratricopeptide (TPR) repeat protein
MPAAELPSLVIQITRAGEDYSVALAFERPDDAGRQAPHRRSAKFRFAALREQARSPERYGLTLGQDLFADQSLNDYFEQAWAAASATLRLVVQIDPEDRELNGLRWETLRHPGKDLYLARDANRPFARLLESQDWSRVTLRSKGTLRALAIAANPTNLYDPNGYQLLDQGYFPVDVQEELARAKTSLQGVAEVDLLFSTDAAPGQASLERLLDALRHGYDILYLVCHGALLRDQQDDPRSPEQSILLLEKSDGSVDRVPGKELVDRVQALPASRRPRLIVLASCQSAGKGIIGTSTDGGALAALGPGLARAGILAVVAMQGDVRMRTVEKFMPVFFSELEKTAGQVDQAMAIARDAVQDEPDWWVPVLFSRLRNGRLYQEEAAPTAREPLPRAGDLPKPGRLPAGARMPYPINVLFTGREAELKELGLSLFYAGPDPPAVVVSGIGGCGKSQLAVELAYRYGRYLDGVHWINGAGDLNSGVADCGQAMSLEKWPDKLPEQVAATLKAWAERTQKGELRLAVLDNLEDPTTLSKWLPGLSGLRLLVTARNERWPKNLKLKLQPLDVLDRPNSLALLRKLAPALGTVADTDLSPIADRFGDLPLGLQLAGAYLRELGLSPREYLEQLEQAGGALHQDGLPEGLQENPLERELNLLRTFNLSWERLNPDKPIDQAARRTFQASGYCAPNTPLPNQALKDALGAQVSSVNFTLGLARLFGLGLLQESEGRPLIHPLLAEFARWQDSTADASVLIPLAKALDTLAQQANRSGLPTQAAPFRPHLKPVVSAVEKIDRRLAASLWGSLGYLLKRISDYPAAQPCFERALAICREVFGEKHAETAAGLNNLAFLLKDMGDYAAARPYFEQALAICREVFGEKRGETAASLNNLGYLLKDMGDYPAARSHFEQALAINREVLGEKRPETAISLNNLGYLLKDMGDYPAARSCFEQALAINREVLGEGHSETATSLTNLGYLLKDMGDYPAARSCFEQALAICREVFGPKHPATATSLNNLAYLLKDTGDRSAARSRFEQALAINREVLGEKHPETATSLNNLGYLLKDMSDYPAARSCFEQALAINREVLGEKHPTTATSLHNLGYLLKDTGDYPAARSCFEQALAIDREVLGEKHRDTATSLNSLGYVLQDMRDYPAARSCFEQALAINQEVLGEEHPDTASSLNNLGCVLKNMGDNPAARHYFERALAILEQTLPPGNALTKTVRSNLEAS